jgi:formamidopyrimidine-DNA glycosylase
MPELPEVETTRLGLLPHLKDRRIADLVVRDGRLRWPIAPDLASLIRGCSIVDVSRRAKYLLIDCGRGHLIIHLGMSGSLRVVAPKRPPAKHDHYDIVLANRQIVRFTDPRRFGSLHWTENSPAQHVLLQKLGPEPLSEAFNGRALFHATRGRTASIKQFLMDQHHVVGVGNIYASEALFRAGVRPQTAAQRVGLARCERIAQSIKHTLQLALKAGGSTLRDFVNSDGEPGSFQLSYRVYDRAGKPCFRCGGAIRTIRQGQRSTFYCATCQR